MREIPLYRSQNLLGVDQIFANFLATLKPSITDWSYFVDWGKVIRGASHYSDELNVLNALIGSADLETDFKRIATKYPQVIGVLPLLIAVRGSEITIASFSKLKLKTSEKSFTASTHVDEAWELFSASGLAALFNKKTLKSVPDYVLGVEVGLDSNGRKNRGGKAMEKVTELFVRDACAATGSAYLKEANAAKLQKEFGARVPVDKTSRRYDFVIKTKSNRLILIETNFYGGGGSKLKATAGEYKSLFKTIGRDFDFVWVTDGPGWKQAHLPLSETFTHNDFVFNLTQLEEGALKQVIQL